MPQIYPLWLLPLTLYFNYLLIMVLVITYFTNSPIHNTATNKNTELINW